MKYLITLILCLILPVLLFAQERTVRVGDTKATIKVEEGKTTTEIKPPEGENVIVVPYDKYPGYGRTQPSCEEIEAINAGDVQIDEDDRGTWKWKLTYTTGFDWVEVLAISRRSDNNAHFIDLWFNWRYNKLKIDELDYGGMIQNYRATYDGEILTDGVYFSWSGLYNYLHRAASGHAGYLDPIPDRTIKVKMLNIWVAHPTNMVGN